LQADRLAAAQLSRMRAMTALYHRLFFADIRISLVVLLGIFSVGLLGAEPIYLAVAPVALLGGAQTAFHASYLIFARQYAARLERFLNSSAGADVLVGAELEGAYLFPLDEPKVVTVAAGAGFSWFGYMTALYTTLGIGAFVAGVAASAASAFEIIGTAWTAAYIAALAILTGATLAAGWWWFPNGEGERRLRGVLDERFPA
jgi:hypothetical protein